MFDKFDNFLGVYSSLKTIHRDAIKICNQGTSGVYMSLDGTTKTASLVDLRNAFKGLCDVEIKYFSNAQFVKIFKTKLKE
tara:strand:- start:37 stop:276 length:240 start_codon:yes stop_codon:yes gene_type:complete